MKNQQKLIVALDVDSKEKALNIVQKLGGLITTYKVGHQLFTAEGPAIIHALKEMKKRVFLDLKLHEISNSVSAAIHSAGQHGVEIVTIHSSGGCDMMKAAVQAAANYPSMKIIALTVVTGLNDQDLEIIGYKYNREDAVLRLANLAKQSGCHGVVASPLEAKHLRKSLGDNIWVMTPGIKILESISQDQQQYATPKEAIENGASHLIIGRSILDSPDPLKVVESILAQIH